jgi:hydroxymethylbilane synthase
LALAQSTHIAERLSAVLGTDVELVTVQTEGDRNMASLATLGGTGVFASALRDALRAGECDLVVHSLKDLPTAPHPGLTIGAVPKRADARDALVSRGDVPLDELPAGARVGTGSPRRQAQVRAHRPDLEVVDIRGNVDTRLRKVSDGELDAVILAAAGLGRLGRAEVVSEYFSLSDWPTAPGQGALALEVRSGEEVTVAKLDHKPTRLLVQAERAVLAGLEAGCAAPVGVTAEIEDGLLFVSGRVYSLDGEEQLTASHALYPEDSKDPAGELAGRIVDELLDAGAADLAPLGNGPSGEVL